MTMRLGDSVMKDTRRSSSGNRELHQVEEKKHREDKGVKVMAHHDQRLMKTHCFCLNTAGYFVHPYFSGVSPLPLSGWWG